MGRIVMILAAACVCSAAVAAIRANADTAPAFLTAAVADPNRPAADRERDANRKPVETLGFAGIKPGDVVAELLPGGGYFTRIISKVVGDSGHVFALVPAPPVDAPASTPDFAARVKLIAADPGYANVSVVVQPFSQLAAPKPVDVVWTSQNYHDVHNFPGVDIGMFNLLVFGMLKPGGLYIILDHAGAPGTGASETSTLHRIDPDKVKAEVLAAGFVLVAESDLLRRKEDPHTAKVFDPAIRGMTDQFLFKFRKPGKTDKP